jgi:hypothetical protein
MDHLKLMKKLEVKIDSSVFVARFLEDLAPVTWATVRKHLPYSSKNNRKPFDGVIHSGWSGWALMTLPPWNTRATLPREKQTIYGAPGEIAIAGVATSDTWIAEAQGNNLHLLRPCSIPRVQWAHTMQPIRQNNRQLG